MSWKKNVNLFNLEVVVPVGSTATVFVPASDAKKVHESGKEINSSEISFQKMENGYAVFVVGSGKYSFDSQL